MGDNYLIIFKAIANFTTCLCEVYGEQYRNLKLYSHLINKTTLAHEKPILKHIEAFKNFCISNQEGIETKNYKIFNNNKIIYSERVCIDLFLILKESDSSTSSVIWKHILTISALVHPSGKAKQLLKETIKSSSNSSSNGEMDFLTNIIEKVEQNVSPNDNPMEAISSIMKSGIFQELITGMGSGLQNGTLDLNKLMGTVQTMVKDINHENGGEGVNDDSMNMINTLMSSMQTTNEDSDGQSNNPPDLSNIMSMMGPLLNNMNNK